MRLFTPADAAVLLAVHRHGTTVEASRRLNLTQSAISKIIARSEASLGVAVFERKDGRLTLRPQAAFLLNALAPVEEEWRQLRSTAARLRSGREMPLRIASTPSIGQGLIARALRRLMEDYPLARVELIMGDPPSELSRGTADLGLMFSPRVTDDIALTPLSSAAIIALVRQDDPLAESSRVRLDDLSRRRLICFDREKSPLGWLIARAYERQGLDYAPLMTVPYSISAAHLMSEPGDVALVDSLLPQAQGLDGLVALAIEPEIAVTVCLMTPRSRPLPRLASRLAAILKDIAGMEGHGPAPL